MKVNEKIKVEVISPKRRKAKVYRENLYKKSGQHRQQRKLTKKEKQAVWNAAVDAAFAAPKR